MTITHATTYVPAPLPSLYALRTRTYASLAMPLVITQALQQGATLAISISGGKDGQALLNALAAWLQEHPVPGKVVAIHADLGRSDWKQTPQHVEHICQAVNMPLLVVRRKKGDLVARWQERMDDLRTKYGANAPPFWSSSQQRYCTSDLKRGPIDNLLRQFSMIISAEGVRAGESPNRAKKPIVALRTQITAKALRDRPLEDALAYRSLKQRIAFTWYPLHEWSERDVWAACGTSRAELDERRLMYATGNWEPALVGWPCHPAYVFGTSRLSCALCILAKRSDLIVGARHNPELYATLVAMEQESGSRFKNDLALTDLADEI